MESPDNKILQEDLERAAALDLPVEALRDARVFVTGATGLLGSQMVKFLLCLNRLKDYHITVIAHVRNREKAERVFPYAGENGRLVLSVGDINERIS